MSNEQLEELETQVPEESTENVEQTTEESTEEKKYTETEFRKHLTEEVDRLLPQKLERRTARLRKEMDGQYGELMGLLRDSTGKQELGDITETLRRGLGKNGGRERQQADYADEDIGILARADAEDIIHLGEDEVEYELSRLNREGAKLNKRQQETVRLLQAHQRSSSRDRELAQIGVPEEVRRSEQFRTFAGQFNANVPMKDVYSLFEKTVKPKKETQTMGSMRNNTPESGLKDFYSYEEAMKFTKADFDRDPALFQRVQESMTKWK